MNQYLRCFFNIPQMSLLNIFSSENETSRADAAEEEDLFLKMEIVLGFNIRKRTKEILNKVGEGDLKACLQLVLDSIPKRVTEEFFSDKEKMNCMRFLIFQLWLILEGVHYTGSRKMNKIPNEFEIDEEISEKEENKKIKIHSVESIQERITKLARGNFLNYLLADDETSSCIKSYDKGIHLKKERKHFRNYYSEAYSQMRVAGLLSGTRDMYNERYQMDENEEAEEKAYSIGVLMSFIKRYTFYLENIRPKDEHRTERDKQFQQYREISVNAMKYMSEMLYAFNVFLEIVKKCSFDQSGYRTELFTLEQYMKQYADVFLIPDIDRRKYYIDMLWDSFKEVTVIDKRTKEDLKYARMVGRDTFEMNESEIEESDIAYSEACYKQKKLINEMRYDTTVYYPLLTLMAIEMIRQFTLKYCKEGDKYLYIIDQLNTIYKGMEDKDRMVSLEYNFSRYADKAPYSCFGLFDTIRKKYFSTKKFLYYFQNKVTLEQINFSKMVHTYLEVFAYPDYLEGIEDPEILFGIEDQDS